MYFVHHGLVDVMSEDGKSVSKTLGPGQWFGEISLITGNGQPASVRYFIDEYYTFS